MAGDCQHFRLRGWVSRIHDKHHLTRHKVFAEVRDKGKEIARKKIEGIGEEKVFGAQIFLDS